MQFNLFPGCGVSRTHGLEGAVGGERIFNILTPSGPALPAALTYPQGPHLPKAAKCGRPPGRGLKIKFLQRPPTPNGGRGGRRPAYLLKAGLGSAAGKIFLEESRDVEKAL